MKDFESPNINSIEWKDKDSLSLLSKLKKEIFWNKIDNQKKWLESQVRKWLDSLKKNIANLHENKEKKDVVLEKEHEKEDLLNKSKSDLDGFFKQIQISSVDPAYIAHASKWPVESAQTVEVLKIHKELSHAAKQKNPLARVAWSIAHYLVS